MMRTLLGEITATRTPVPFWAGVFVAILAALFLMFRRKK
jgi:LPXTG-motif cell wall-anchored protein